MEKIAKGILTTMFLFIFLGIILSLPATIAADYTPTDTLSTSSGSLTPTELPTPIPSIADPSLTPDLASNIASTSATDSNTVTASNSADLTNNINTTSSTGNNTVISTPHITVQTGNAVSIVTGDNSINTTSINSDVTSQTINIFGDQTGDIDLSTLFQLVSSIVTNDNTTTPVVNIQVTGVNNYAYLSNNVVSTANTGGNIVDPSTGSGQVVVNTGNADSVVSLINTVNLTVVNSSLHLVTVNIFGHLTGNIILPNLALYQSTSCTSCGVSFNTNNQTVVDNNINSTANTGGNSITASSEATLTTGNAVSKTNVVNLINENILGMIFENLFVNDFGNWNGGFLGWDNFDPQGSGTIALSSESLAQETNPTSSTNNTGNNSTAYVNNNVYSSANTGDNTASGQHINLTTANAYSLVSLTNFINTNFLKTLGFFGFINIFGNWDGNIGRANTFITPTPTPQENSNNTGTDTTQQGSSRTQNMVASKNARVDTTADNILDIQRGKLGTSITNQPFTTPSVTYKAVLGTSTHHNNNTDLPLFFALLGIFVVYIFVRILQAKDQLVLLFTPGFSLKSRLNMLRLLLF